MNGYLVGSCIQAMGKLKKGSGSIWKVTTGKCIVHSLVACLRVGCYEWLVVAHRSLANHSFLSLSCAHLLSLGVKGFNLQHMVVGKHWFV